VDFSAISLRKSERALLAGGVEAGKSTLEEALIADWWYRYPNGRTLILDSKPRFRGAYDSNGRSAAHRYKHWDHGSYVPGSVVIDHPNQLDLAWSTGARIVIAQAAGARTFPLLEATCNTFYDQSRAGRPQLLAVDEAMDFFHGNGTPIGGDSLIRSARSGREIGLAALFCSQRTKGFPTQLMDYLAKLYLFRVDYIKDVQRTHEMGAPKDLRPPDQQRQFRYWTKADYHTVYGPYQLQLGRSAPPAGVTPVTFTPPAPVDPDADRPRPPAPDTHDLVRRSGMRRGRR
jgi:hypothetical protein